MEKQKTKISILFVCLGNICRSPAAEGVMKTLVKNAGLSSQIHIESAGVGHWHVGELPDRRMRRQASLRGYSLDSRAQQFIPSFFSNFSMILVMDNGNYNDIASQATTEEEKKKIYLLSDFFKAYKGQNTIPDPYYGNTHDFDFALDLIEDACAGLLEYLVRL